MQLLHFTSVLLAILLFPANINNVIVKKMPAAKVCLVSANGGNISFIIDGKDWKDNNALATQTGSSFLNIASDNDKTEAISIIINHPATGNFSFNKGVSGSYTEAAGASYGSKDGTGNIIITRYIAPAGKINGLVEGSFSGTFNFNPLKKHVVTNGKFSMPVQKL